MKIQILPRMSIADLQHEFRECFPNLSLAFYTKPHDIFQASPVKYLITDQYTLLERIESEPHEATLEIYADMKVFELEQLFESEFGLHVQVMRRDGNRWTESTITDSFSLRQQNDNTELPVDPLQHIAHISSYRDARTEWYLG